MSEYIIDMSNSSYRSASGLLCADVSQLREKIVRCRDCKYYKPWVLSRPENGGDCVLNKVEVDVWFDGFCAWGKRKEL